MADLRTDYKDDVLDISVNERRKYRMENNEDGTVSFIDETEYLQRGDDFGAREVNKIHNALNNSGGSAEWYGTLEEYNALPDTKYTDGVKYYIKDAYVLAGGGGIGNVRYNEKTDMVQIYFGGEWVDWKYGNMKAFYLIKNGAVIGENAGGLIGRKCGLGSATKVVPIVNGASASITTSGEGTVFNEIAFDATKYSKIYMEYKIASTHANSIVQMGFSSTNTERDSFEHDLLASHSGVVDETFVKEIDISTINGMQYLFAWLYYPSSVSFQNVYMK